MARLSKLEAQTRHAYRRFAERLPDDAPSPAQIRDRIRRQESIESWRHTVRCALHVLIVCGRIEVFVYDRQRHQVVTVLPPEDNRVAAMRRKHRNRLQERNPHAPDRTRLAS